MHLTDPVFHGDGSCLSHPGQGSSNKVLKQTLAPSDTLLWEIQWSRRARKKAKTRTVKNLFLTAVVGDRLVLVSHALMKGRDEDAAYKYLEKVATSLERQDSTIDLATIQERVRNE